MTKQLTDPPTEIEVAELVTACRYVDALGMLSRRLAYDRDRLQTAANRLADALVLCVVDFGALEPGETVESVNFAKNLAREIIATREGESNEA